MNNRDALKKGALGLALRMRLNSGFISLLWEVLGLGIAIQSYRFLDQLRKLHHHGIFQFLWRWVDASVLCISLGGGIILAFIGFCGWGTFGLQPYGTRRTTLQGMYDSVGRSAGSQ